MKVVLACPTKHCSITTLDSMVSSHGFAIVIDLDTSCWLMNSADYLANCVDTVVGCILNG